MSKLKEEAARWFVRMFGAMPDDPERGRFEAWLAAHPAHAQAYASIEATWSDLESMPRSKALAQAMNEQRKRERMARRRFLKRGGAGLALIALGAEGFHYRWRTRAIWSLARQTDVATLGQEILPDGSKLVLNAASEVAVVLSRGERRVGLKRGEIILDVAEDAARPFVVDGGAARVTVLGTRFAVARFNGKVRVSVARGRVQIDAGSFWRRQQLTLGAGQVAEVTVQASQGPRLRLVGRKASEAFEFETGMLVFDDADLAEVAETLNRYRRGVIRVTEHNFAPLPKITAGVPAANVEQFIDLLPTIASVNVRRSGADVELTAR